MVWTAERKRFVEALIMFLIWVALLTALVVVSAKPPAARTAKPVGPIPAVESPLTPR